MVCMHVNILPQESQVDTFQVVGWIFLERGTPPPRAHRAHQIQSCVTEICQSISCVTLG